MTTSVQITPVQAATGQAATGAGTTTSIPASLGSLTPWVDAGVFGPAEVHGAEVLTRADPSCGSMLHLAAACALWAPLHGHACVDLERIAATVTAEIAVMFAIGSPLVTNDPGGRRIDDSAAAVHAVASSLPWPATGTWLAELHASPLVRRVDHADDGASLDDRPLVLHRNLLYTQRQWSDECIVAAQLRRRASATARQPFTIAPEARDLLERLLPPLDDDLVNLQHTAAATALSSHLAVVVGGPGTGKTHTIARTLAVLVADAAATGRVLRIGLAAPTGKAAARMSEAISSAVVAGVADGLLSAELGDSLSQLTTSTIHRLLGRRGSATRFAHDADTPLPYDVVVVDEASMVALPLMARLLEAVRLDARLVLVGDPDQLNSIEVGAVLADIVVAAADDRSPLHPLTVRLERARRQQHGSPISALADAVRDNNPDMALAALRGTGQSPHDQSLHDHSPHEQDPHDEGGRALLTFVETPDPIAGDGGSGARDAVLDPLVAAAHAATHANAADALAHFATVRMLCAHRSGRHGTESWNRLIESWVLDALAPGGHGRPQRFYPGRPLLATRNDARQRVANGDTGIVIADPAGVRAAFGTSDGLRVLAPAQLERVETAFATTIHKSQGSEFDTVVVVLPPANSPLAGRELLYTAITRARRRLVVIGTEASVRACIAAPSRRVTGLAAALTGG